MKSKARKSARKSVKAKPSRSRARKGEPTKKAVSIRLSKSVLSFFKSKGPGWQTRIDRALKAFADAFK